MKTHRKILAEDLHYIEASNIHPANTYFHFSFANYYNPKNMNFGVLRVINDDRVKPLSGFGTHPHQNMEIFSYVVDGKLTHRDSAGNLETLERGHVQCISAGTGLTHSEINDQEDWCRFLQIWVMPEALGLPIRYDLEKFNFEDRNNKLLQIISNTRDKKIAALYLCQDVNVYVSELTNKETHIPFTLNEDRQAYIYCFEGSIDIDAYPSLNENDSMEVLGRTKLDFSLASEKAHFIMIEMKKETVKV
jgi:quercetin 2,3-dioxygenase